MSVAVRLGILTTHPIQYQVPWFRALVRVPEIDLTVLYCMLPDARQQGEGFGVEFQWDLPLLDGYRYEVLANVARNPSVTAFLGCDTPAVREVIRARGFDCVIVNGWVVKSCLQALWACRREGIPCLVRGESNAFRRRPLWVRALHRLLLRQYSAFLAIGQANRQFYLANGISQERLFDAPYCVDNARFAADAARLEPSRGQIRQSWRIPDEARAFLFCGKLIEKKRPLDLLAALASVVPPATGRPVHLLVAGDGPLRASCESFAEQRRLPVTFAGFLNQSEVARAYVAADCLVLPSDDGETWGLVVNEAMACGRPAIVSDRVGCHPDLVLPGRTGFVFPLGDCQSLAGLLAALAKDADTARHLGQGARERVSGYSISRLVEGTMKAVDHTLTARATRR